MKKLFLILTLMLIATTLQATDLHKWNAQTLSQDNTAPTVSSTAVGSNGTTWTMTFSEFISGAVGTWSGSCSTAGAITLSSCALGSAPATTMTCTGGTTVNSGDTCTVTSSGTSIVDRAARALTNASGSAVTNNSTSSYATPAVVQSNSDYNSGPATLSSPSTTGNTLVVCTSGTGDTSATTIASGGGVSSWNSGTSRYDTNNTNARCYYGYVTSGGAVSVSFDTPPTDAGWVIYELSGVASTSALDGENYGGTNTFFDGSWDSAAVSTSQTHVGMIAYAASESGAVASFAWAGGWGSTLTNTDHAHYSAFRAVTSQSSYTASGTNTGTSNGLVILMVFKAASL